MKEVIEQYKDVVIQINTPYGSGSGFYVADSNLIVTNRHVIQGCTEVAVSGENYKKVITEVMYADATHDLAFLRLPDSWELPRVELSDRALQAGETIMAIGHPLGLKFTATQGIVSKAERQFNGINYVQVDAAINPGNSGGPLINENGELVGVNTFIMRDSESLGFALPINYLRGILEEYRSHHGTMAIKCSSCSILVTENTVESGYCPNCGNKVDESEFKPRAYEAAGHSKVIESILEKIGVDVRIARVGQNAWDVEEGSALIKIDYNTKNGFIYGDAHLCKIPRENIGEMYEFLLRENYNLEGVVFSTTKQDIMLSLLIYDHDLTEETGVKLFQDLFQKADHYDDILIERFGATPVVRH